MQWVQRQFEPGGVFVRMQIPTGEPPEPVPPPAPTPVAAHGALRPPRKERAVVVRHEPRAVPSDRHCFVEGVVVHLVSRAIPRGPVDDPRDWSSFDTMWYRRHSMALLPATAYYFEDVDVAAAEDAGLIPRAPRLLRRRAAR
jgi:hypothetical protein